MSSSYKAPLQDIFFLLEEVLDWQQLFSLSDFKELDRESAMAVLEEGAKLAEEVIAPINGPGDEQGCRLKEGRVVLPEGYGEAFDTFATNGWFGVDLPGEYGGQGLPWLVQTAFSEMLSAASLAFGMMPISSRAAAWLLHEHADEELRQLVIPNIASGRWTTTIAISEAQAGSDVGRINTKAKPSKDNRYLVSGTKIFISWADHSLAEQIVHLVLARTEGAPAGPRGLSLFLVPRIDFDTGKLNGVSVSRVEKKMGLKGSPTCVVEFEDALGYRIGQEHQGLNTMFTMMNIMRMECATQGVGIATAALQRATVYALERPQGGPSGQAPHLIIEHADVRRMLLGMKARTGAMRALLYQLAFFLDQARSSEASSEQAGYSAIAEFLLPVCKTCSAENGFETANHALQVFGGHGYVADAGIEQYVRDARVISIYEGTSGIQAQDLVKRKLLGDGGERYQLLSSCMKNDLGQLAQDRLGVIHSAVTSGLAQLDRCTQSLLDDAASKDSWSNWVASDYLQLVGLVAGGWMWLRMAAAAGGNSRFHQEQRMLAEFYADWVMAEIPARVTRIENDTAELDKLSAELFDDLQEKMK